MAQTFAFYGDSAIGQIVADNLQAAGFELADSIEAADAVFSYCLSQEQLEDAYWGSNGILSKAKADACLVDLSPSTPSFAKESYALARASELQALDAPISVRDITSHHAFSDTSDVVMFVGGEKEIVERMMPMLKVIAQTVHHTGMPGSGQLAKLSLTIQLSAQLMALVESHAICRANDETAQSTIDLAVEDAFISPQTKNLCHAIEHRHFHGSYTAQVLFSELMAVQNASEDTDVVLAQAEACCRLVQLFMVVGGADLNATALGLVYADKEECDRYQLDWSRAEGLYQQEHEHAHDHAVDEAYDEFDDYDDSDGYGAFSSN